MNAADLPDGAASAVAREPSSHSRRSAMTGLLWDIGPALAVYYALHLLGASDWTALLAATVAAGVRVVVVAVRSRAVTWFAVVMLAAFGLGLVLAFTGGDARFLVLKDSMTNAAVGAVFLTSLLTSRPLTLSAFQTWQPSDAGEWERRYREEPAGRRAVRVSTTVWGVGLIVQAVATVPVIYLLSPEVSVGLTTAMTVVAIALLATWNVAYARRRAGAAR